MASMCSWLMLWVGLQKDEDYCAYQEWVKNDLKNPPAYYPRFSSESFETVEGGQMVQLDSLLKKQEETLLFRLKDGRIIRYQANCLRPSDSHPVARHFFLLNLLKDTGIAPQVYALSGPRRLVAETSKKTDFKLDSKKRSECVENGGTVRFMIMEDAGHNMLEWIRAQKNKQLAGYWSLYTFRNLMNKIKTLHSFGIVHGDIHPLNVMSKQLPEVKLIDFELSLFRSEISSKMKEGFNHIYYSHWEIAGHRPSFRDDVFRGVLVGAILIGGEKWYKHCQELNEADMLELKTDSFLFEIPGVFTLDELISNPETRSEVRKHLGTVLRLAREPRDVWSHANIDGIIESLDAIFTIAEEA